MKTLIVAPRFVGVVGEYYDFPLGLAYVSAVLKRAGFEVATMNLNHIPAEDCAGAVRRAIDEGGADVVCCGGLSAHYRAIKDVVEAARSAARPVRVVLGGGIISSEPELMLEALDADAAVFGEGEETSLELMARLEAGGDLAGVKGVVYRGADGRAVKNAPRPYIKDLDAYPRPDYEGFEAGTYLDLQRPGDSCYLNEFDNPRLLPMILSRSCPFNCTFCYHPLGTKYRRRSLDRFFEDLDHLVATYKINMLAVLDELFSLDREGMEFFCRRMKQYGLKWIAQLRVDQVDRETLSMLKDSGLYYISYGIESASDTVLKSMRKHIKIEQISAALALTKELGIGIQGNFIMGDPAETPKTAAQTLSWWKEHPYYHINFTALIPYPGSVLYTQCLKRGLITDRLEYIEQGCPSLNMTAMDTQTYNGIFADIRKAQFENRQFCRDVVVSPGRFDTVKNLQLYRLEMTCPHCAARNAYDNYTQARLEIVKLVCRNCHQRSDLSASHLPPFRKIWAPLLDVLEGLAKSGAPVSLTPVGNEYLFQEMLLSLGFDWRRINARCALDYDKSKEGGSFMGLPVLHRSAENLRGACAGHHFIVLPCERPKLVLRDLIDNGVGFEAITYLGSKLGLSGLGRPYGPEDLRREMAAGAPAGAAGGK